LRTVAADLEEVVPRIVPPLPHPCRRTATLQPRSGRGRLIDDDPRVSPRNGCGDDGRRGDSVPVCYLRTRDRSRRRTVPDRRGGRPRGVLRDRYGKKPPRKPDAPRGAGYVHSRLGRGAGGARERARVCPARQCPQNEGQREPTTARMMWKPRDMAICDRASRRSVTRQRAWCAKVAILEFVFRWRQRWRS
jgi:hypothetical protein